MGNTEWKTGDDELPRADIVPTLNPCSLLVPLLPLSDKPLHAKLDKLSNPSKAKHNPLNPKTQNPKQGDSHSLTLTTQPSYLPTLQFPSQTEQPMKPRDSTEEKEMGGISKEAQLSIAASSMFPGFRFSPTDEELISYYLKNKLDNPDRSVEVISEVDICNFEPWDLPAKAVIHSENEWFFFSPRGRKYPNGSQSRRATELGYWKATGKERNVKSSSNVIGTKRTLVFHIGRAPRGERTEWIMHEYCMVNDRSQDSMVVCRLRKNNEFRLNDSTNRGSSSQSPSSTMQNSENVVFEGGTNQGEKATDCNSKKSTSSYDSHSTEQMDSASDSYQKLTPEGTQIESSGRQKGLYDDDYFADILKDDIIILDESSASVADNKLPVVANNSESHEESMQPIVSQSIPFQGTANRRIRLRRGKLKLYSQAPLEGTTSEQSPKGLANSHLLIYVYLCLLVLLVLFLSNFCFSKVSSSVSFYAERFLASEKHK